MKDSGGKRNGQEINARLDQTMIGLDADALAQVVRWMDEPLTEVEADGYRRLARAKGIWANDAKS